MNQQQQQHASSLVRCDILALHSCDDNGIVVCLFVYVKNENQTTKSAFECVYSEVCSSLLSLLPFSCSSFSFFLLAK
eukprot:m.19092 g.19092  ORF g.19092 m.19092 type:complete len:77 (+) comp8406_c0_seq1:26-256(+)